MSLPLADQLLLLLATPDRRLAAQQCAALITGGLPLDRLVDEGLAPAMRQVGSLCVAGVFTVADEHIATAAAEAGLSAAAAAAAAATGARALHHGEVVLACVEGDWHSLPARMITEVLIARGWSVRFRGASHPTDLLIDHLLSRRPVAVLLSCAIPTALPALMDAVTRVRAMGLPVYVGGRALGSDGRRARAVGADGWAPDAAGVADLLLDRPVGAVADRVEERLKIYRSQQALAPAWVDDASDWIGVGSELADLRWVLDMACVAVLLADPTLLVEQCRWLIATCAGRGAAPDTVARSLVALGQTRPPVAVTAAVGSALAEAELMLGASTSPSS